MSVYISMLIIAIFFMFLSTKCESKNEKIFFAILTTLPFIIVSTIRYDVGTDYLYRYVPNYFMFVHGGIERSLEPLFILLIKICILFSKDHVIMIAATSIIINALIMITIFKYSKNPILSILIFFCGSFYFQSMNLIRQFIAMTILLVSYRMLFNNKSKFLYIVMVGIATLFHSMSAVALISLFLEKKEIKFKYCAIMIIIIILLGGYLGNIVEFIVTNTPLNDITNIVKYVKYFKMGGNVFISSIVVETSIYIYMWMMFKKLKEKNKEIEKEAIFFVNMQSVTLLCTIMNIHFDLFFRVGLLFSIFQIISIPYFWLKNKDEDLKIFSYTIKKGVMFFTILVVCLMTSKMLFSNVIKGSDEVLPYKTIFHEKRVKDGFRRQNNNIICIGRTNSERWTREFYS